MITESFSFRTAIFDALCSRLDLDRDSADASAMIHEAYAEPEVTPRLPGNRNAAFRTVLREPGAEDRPCEYTPEPSGTGRHTQVVYTTLCCQQIIVCYGPDSGEYAHRIRSMLFPDGSGFPRRILRDAGICPVPGPPRPVLLHGEGGLPLAQARRPDGASAETVRPNGLAGRR